MDILQRPFAAAVMTLACLVSIPAEYSQTQLPAPSEDAQRPSRTKSWTRLQPRSSGLRALSRTTNNRRRELAKAVTEQGLSVEEYTAILEVAQKDPDVLEKLKKRIRPSVE